MSLFVPEIFKFLKYANYQRMTSYTSKKRYLNQFVSEMFDSWQ